ncbi:hypothetical protein MYX65_00050 [Acidobacteria bacterium AH-259-L09]|nr:hypothetical protein [Acidobacteria bacterium AH-259-L09]
MLEPSRRKITGRIKEFLHYRIGPHRQRALWTQYGRATTGIDIIPTSSQGLKILVWLFRVTSYPTAVEATLAAALRLRGHRVTLFACNRVVDICDNHMLGDDKDSICHRCCYGASLLAQKGHLPALNGPDLVPSQIIMKLDQIAQETPVEDIGKYEYKGIPLGGLCISSVLRHTLKGEVDPERDERIIRRYFRSALGICETADAVLEQLAPDRLLTSHGIYISWGIVMELARRRNIPVTVWGTGYPRPTLLFVHGDTYHRALGDEGCEAWENGDLTEDEADRLDKYINSKWEGSFQHDHRAYYTDREFQNPEEIRRGLGLRGARKTIALFPDIVWDAEGVYGKGAFPNRMEWLRQTVAWFISRPDLQLVIRAHPSEVRAPKETRQKVLDELEACFPRLPTHIRVIPPDDPLSSYEVANIIDVALMHSTKFGLELALRGVPVVVCGKAPYRNKGFTHDVVTREQYFDLLERLQDLLPMTEQELQRARRYAYYFYFRRHQTLDLVQATTILESAHQALDLTVGSSPAEDMFAFFPLAKLKFLWSRYALSGTRFNFRSIDELKPGKHSVLDFLCDRIVHGGDFVLPTHIDKDL